MSASNSISRNEKTVLILGGTGFIGRELGILLTSLGYSVRILTRANPNTLLLPYPAKIIQWRGDIPAEAISECFAVVNLAGDSVASGRWTDEKKESIIASRRSVAASLIEAINRHHPKLRVLVQASAIGFYGDRNDLELDENSPPGTGFLAETCLAWENSLDDLPETVRKVTTRIGVVLGHGGGALSEIAEIYGKGLGAVLGSGKQYMSWIHIADICKFISEAIEIEGYSGTYNLTAPHPVQNSEFHQAMMKYFTRSSPLKVPEFVLKTVLGEKSKLVLDSQNVKPRRALAQGFKFNYTTIEQALDSLYSEKMPNSFILLQKQWVPFKRDQVWDFFSSEKNLERITPPWLNFKVVKKSSNEIENGTLIDYRLKIHGIPVAWQSEIIDFEAPNQFVDKQLKGPYKLWHHRHAFVELADGTLLIDLIHFSLPVGMLGAIFGMPLAKIDLNKIFNYRKKIIGTLFSN
ncbi:MAG: TIGR01777 family oxidoreductase [Oligoflexales bacterium]|nr:TIGR01777 family oxidoreductase [Oligoflexales bacterium]